MTSTTDRRPAQPAGERAHEPVRWLDEQQQTDWRAFRDGIARLMDVLGHELEADSGLSLHEYELMVRLSEAPDRTLRMSQLAAGLAHSRSRLTHTVRRMEQAGMVVRRACTSDARGVECVMTDAGWQALVAAAPAHVASVRRHLVDVLTPAQFRALGDAMATVGVALDGAGCPDAVAVYDAR